MNQKPASKETITSLYTTMGRNFLMFTPILCSFVDSYERFDSSDKVEKYDLSMINRLILCKELRKLSIASMMINLDLSTFLRANFSSLSTTEKRCNLKYVNVITYEGFNYFFGKKDKANAPWSQFINLTKEFNDEELN